MILGSYFLLFAYWLGGDIGVFYSAFQVRDRNLSVEVRRTAGRTRPFVLAIWALLAIAAYVGISKPDFGFML